MSPQSPQSLEERTHDDAKLFFDWLTALHQTNREVIVQFLSLHPHMVGFLLDILKAKKLLWRNPKIWKAVLRREKEFINALENIVFSSSHV